MRNLRIICAVIGTVMLASAIWGWWGFGIAAAIAVAGVMIVVSNRRPAAGGNQQAQQPAARVGRQPDRVVQILENIGGLVSLVVFAGLAIAVIGLVQKCGEGVSDELARLHETANAQASTQPPIPTAPQPTRPLGKSPTGDPIYASGTVLHFTTTTLCGEWKLRIINAEWQKREKATGKELVQWFPVNETDFFWTMTRDGWVETKGNTGCQIRGEALR